MSSAPPFSDTPLNQHKRLSSKSNPGFLERLSDTAGGTLVGVGLFFLSIYILFTNEGRALQTKLSLDEGLSQVVPLDSYFGLDPQNNNRLVHLTAKLHTAQPLHDPNYRVVVQAVKLRREVEMYQWVEYSESSYPLLMERNQTNPNSLEPPDLELGDYQENGETKTETTYTYNTEWKSELVNSRNFDKEIGHQNPSAMAVESVTVVAPEVRAGPFLLSKGLIEKINNFQTLSLRDFNAINLDPFLTILDDYFYHTQYPHRPEVGDVRVRFSFAGLSGEESWLGPPVSVVAMQRGAQLMPFKTKSGDILEFLYLESLSAEEIFGQEHQSNSMKTWGLRVAGWALMCLGIQLAMRIIYTLVDWVPVLRELVSVGIKIFALCLSCSLSLLVIAVGWLAYRPLVAFSLAAIGLIPLLIARSGFSSKKDE